MKSLRWEKKMLKKLGWYMDAIFADEYNDIHANYHTHGVQENFNHLDFQIVLNMDPEVANNIFFTLIDNVKNGITYEVDKQYSNVIDGFNIIFKQYKEIDRVVLRVLLPDEDGILPTDDKCDEVYKAQLEYYDFESVNN